MRSFQSRLGAKTDKLIQKLSDNAITLTGSITDVIRITAKLGMMQDIESRVIDGIDVVEIMFPPLKDVPMKRFLSGAKTTSANDGAKSEPFECYAPISAKINQDDIILKFFENPQGDDPWVLPLEIKEALGTFNTRSIIWQKYLITYYNEEIPQKVYEWCLDMAKRREKLKW